MYKYSGGSNTPTPSPHVDSEELSFKIRIMSLKKLGSDTLSFAIGVVREDIVIYRTTGWRVGRGRVQVPSMKTQTGYLPTAIVTEKFMKLITMMLVHEWGPLYKDVEFPEILESNDLSTTSK